MNEEEIRFLVRDELRKILDKGLMYSAEVEKREPVKKQDEIPSEQALMANFPEELRNLMVAEEKAGVWELKFKHFIRGEEGQKAWAKANAVIKNLGGKWVSAGKDSRWVVPK